MTTKLLIPLRVVGLCALMSIVTAFAGTTTSSPAHARTQTTGYTLTLQADGSTTIGYGTSTSRFFAIFDHPETLPPGYSTVFIAVDGIGKGSGNATPLSNTETQYSFGPIAGLSPGTHQVQASYSLLPDVVSNIVTVTVGKGSATLGCNIHNLALAYSPNQSITVDMMVYPSDADWQNGTFGVTFTGPTTVKYPSLKPNSQEQVTVQAPSTPGQYQLVCVFNGSPNYNASGSYSVGALISGKHQTGPIQLYTNPTTVTTSQQMTWYVVIPAAPGLPTPTGYFNISIGRSSTQAIQLGPQGTATVQNYVPLLDNGGVKINYNGDGVYNAETASFPLTNPPIPGAGGGPSPTQPPGAKTTPTPGSTTPTTVAGTPSTTPVVAIAGSSTTGEDKSSNSSASSGANPLPILLGALVLVGLASGVGGTLLLRRRTVPATTSGPEHVWTQEPRGFEDTVPTPRMTPPPVDGV